MYLETVYQSCQSDTNMFHAGVKASGSSVTDGYAGGSTGDEIIELQDIRLSPIPSIRNRHNSAR